MSELITRVGECTIAVPMPEKPRLRWSNEAELRSETLQSGFEIATYNLRDWEPCLLLMGGEWIKGFRGGTVFCTYNQTVGWDLENQPTRWKPV